MLRKYGVSLKRYCSFKIGGRANSICFPNNEKEFLKEITRCQNNGKKFYILGNGSNVLFLDRGFAGKIISTRLLNKIYLQNDEICCEAGVNLNFLCKYCAEHGLMGIENLFGIPGTVGGAVVMNAGAYGCEICKFIKKIRIFKNGKIIEKTAKKFSYRKGPLTDNEILLSVTFSLNKGKKENIQDLQNCVMKKRRESQPLNMPSAGSVFKRGKDFFPAKLIDEWGLKGFKKGGAMISNKHAGFIVNFGNATSEDVLYLINFVETYAKEKGYNFEREIIVVK